MNTEPWFQQIYLQFVNVKGPVKLGGSEKVTLLSEPLFHES